MAVLLITATVLLLVCKAVGVLAVSWLVCFIPLITLGVIWAVFLAIAAAIGGSVMITNILEKAKLNHDKRKWFGKDKAE